MQVFFIIVVIAMVILTYMKIENRINQLKRYSTIKPFVPFINVIVGLGYIFVIMYIVVKIFMWYQ